VTANEKLGIGIVIVAVLIASWYASYSRGSHETTVDEKIANRNTAYSNCGNSALLDYATLKQIRVDQISSSVRDLIWQQCAAVHLRD